MRAVRKPREIRRLSVRRGTKPGEFCIRERAECAVLSMNSGEHRRPTGPELESPLHNGEDYASAQCERWLKAGSQ
jgi:hypothetical protein